MSNFHAMQVMGVRKQAVSLQGVKPKYMAGGSYHADASRSGASRKVYKMTGQATKQGK